MRSTDKKGYIKIIEIVRLIILWWIIKRVNYKGFSYIERIIVIIIDKTTKLIR